MTIAIGLCGNEGIVLAADSQETISGYIKGHTGKIETIMFPSLNVLAFAGSGPSDYIKTAIEKAIVGIGDLKAFPDIQEALEENLLEFFDKHLARWAYFPENERPTVELLIGISLHKGPFGLFYYSGTSFHRVYRKAIGAGILLADSLISEYASESVSVEEASSAAVYILSKVKKRIDTCGGFTDLVALRMNGDFALTDSTEIQKLEEELEAVEEESLKDLKAKIVAKTPRLSWQRYVLAHKLIEFNAAWNRRTDCNGRTIATQDDFLEIRDENTFIQILRSASIITNDVRKILDEKLGFRNTCAHPNDIVIPESKVLAAVEDLVYNVVLKYPL